MKYLIPFDFTTVSKNAVKHALRLAKMTSGELFLLHLIKDKDTLKIKDIELKNFLNTFNPEQNVTFSGQVVVGDIFNDIGRIAEYHGADLVVMGTHGVDAMQKLFGSNVVKIIRESSVPFIVIQENCDLKHLNKIVLPFSIETKSMQVLRFASTLSKIYDAEIHLIGRKHDDEFLKHKEHSNVIMAKKYLLENKIKHSFELIDIPKNKFQDYVLEYAANNEVDLIATTYFSDSIMPMFEKFVQNLIINNKNIPVLCLNAKSLSKSDSILSFMTS
jgi:nucleotide-binding universal stress UspA family protein